MCFTSSVIPIIHLASFLSVLWDHGAGGLLIELSSHHVRPLQTHFCFEQNIKVTPGP